MNRKKPTSRGTSARPGGRSQPRTGKPRTAAQAAAHEPKRKAGRWVIGLHSCQEVLKVRPRAISDVWLRTDWERSEDLTLMAERTHRYHLKPQNKSVSQLDTLGHGHQGVAFLVTEDPQLDWEILKADKPQIVLILDGLEDPQNLGSILRTSWLTEVAGIFTPDDRAVGLTNTVCKIASGGAEYIPVERVSNFAPTFERLKELGFWVYGLAEKGEQVPWQLKLPQKVAWVVGSEGSGLRITTERMCDELVRLPQAKTGSSYNASIAVAMALGETIRQHKTLL
jgi:23S rRNA (guanosine2251-2'-O)-methyltransferase